MLILRNKKELKSHVKKLKSLTIGFVPTMGALHQGHISLIKKSVRNNTYTVVSIFVNPTQFDKEDDLENYPRTEKEDLLFLRESGCNAVFIPSTKEIYKNGVAPDKFNFDGLEKEMEGQFRADHFDGVGTIVKTLFEIVKPTNAYFGEKDFQQLQIVRKMVKKTKLPVTVVGCPIYREENGLAMSSRNERLSKNTREEARIIFQTLKSVKEMISSRSIKDIKIWVENQFEKHPLFELEYFTIADEDSLKSINEKSKNYNLRAFIAVRVNSVRLIDNISLKA